MNGLPQQRTTRASSQHEAAYDDSSEYRPEQRELENSIIEINRPVAPEPSTKRCWICFEEESDSAILAQGMSTNWRQPCKCTLVAHEECLLTWVDETQKTTAQGVNSSRTIRCPQCKEPYNIRSRNSLGVSLMTFVDSWITKGLFATIPLGFLKAIGVTCFYYGQGAMLDVLGEDRLTDLILSLKPGDEIRYIIGASCIPFALVGSRFDLCNFVLPLIPSLVCFSDTSFIQSRRPMESSPALWICVLPWLRNLYCFSWRLLLGPTEKRWKSEAGLLSANITELAPGIGIREVPAEEQARAMVEGPIDEHDHEDDAVAERWIFVEAPKFARLIAGALLLPKIAMAAGNMLDRVPSIRKRYPHKFQRVIIGGLTFVVMKDVLSLVFLYNRAKGRSTRHILNRQPLRS